MCLYIAYLYHYMHRLPLYWSLSIFFIILSRYICLWSVCICQPCAHALRASCQAKLITDNADTVTKITSMIQAQYQALQNQHHEFSNHLHMQLSSMQHQLSILLQQEQQCMRLCVFVRLCDRSTVCMYRC